MLVVPEKFVVLVQPGSSVAPSKLSENIISACACITPQAKARAAPSAAALSFDFIVNPSVTNRRCDGPPQPVSGCSCRVPSSRVHFLDNAALRRATPSPPCEGTRYAPDPVHSKAKGKTFSLSLSRKQTED